MIRSPFVIVTGAIVGWFIVAFLIWPNANLLVQTFVPDGEPTLRAVEKLASSERAMTSLGNSFLLAFVLSVTVNVVGIFVVLVTRYYDIRGGRILWLGYATTLIYGGIVLAAGYKFVYGADGIITGFLLRLFPEMDPDWFSGFFAVVVVMTLATTTNHLLFVSSALSKVDHQTIEAARSMGASEWTILRRVVLPMLKPVLFAVTILTFLGGLGALSAPQVLGGRDFQTITPIILTFAATPSSRDIAALLALVLGIATVLLLIVLTRIEKGGTYFSIAKVSSQLVKQKIRNPVLNVAVHVVAYALFAAYLLPVILIVLYSFQDSRAIESGQFRFSTMSLDNYARVLGESASLRPFVISIVYAGLASLISVLGLLFVARIIAKHRNAITLAAEYLLHIPWILPTTLIALGLIISYDHPSPLVGGRVLTGTTVILLIAYVIGKIPFTLRLLKAAFSVINDNLEEAASLMGARTLYVFRRILLPAVLPTVLAIGALNFNSLLDDYDTSVFLAHPLFQPLGLVIKASTEGDANLDARANTFVYTVLLMIITGATMYLVYGRGARDRGGRRARARRQRDRVGAER
ncbi:MAG: ABC transporter permease [Brachybacterium tyrofermentans]|uniref:ABC transporter permease n=1 Tax=Brachybacterium tyrofermentans TaxID=47848 RepID=A0ABW0FK49_9MICO|nr:iron ABC transporter permease [Brachybacterium tyrofermentans]